MRTATRIGALGATAVLSLVLAACGGSDAGSMDHSSMSSTSSSSSSASPTAAVDAAHNDQDVMFAQQMIVHHQSAIDMAEMATTKASSQEVKTLAASIEAAQSPEIETMTSWLNAWGESVTADSSMSGMDHSAAMPGMMTDEQMSQLDAATGADFDRMFLQMMTTHHEGAIEMAKTEQASGSNPQATALAADIESSQTAEVAQMAQMLATLG